MVAKYIYAFGTPDAPHPDGIGIAVDQKALLGGKGAALATMCVADVPVPPGFTLTTQACLTYRVKGDPWLKTLLKAHAHKQGGKKHLATLKDHFGYMPLVSVRSGARVSMPGMMDTVLNVGITSKNFPEWENRIGTRAALDSRRRLIQMFGTIALEIEDDLFTHELNKIKKAAGVTSDADLDEVDLAEIVSRYLELVKLITKKKFPDTLEEQLFLAIRAVFRSWDNPRAVHYRKMHKIPDDWGTAVTVQAMVFGNMNAMSSSGVMFTRHPVTGDNVLMGEYLINAQGEDVVSGARTPMPLETLPDVGAGWNVVLDTLAAMAVKLETHYADMQDIEFTIQDEKVYILQTRSGKRTAEAAFKIAVDMAEEGIITKLDALSRLTRSQYFNVCTPRVDEAKAGPPLATGLSACGGVAIGRVVFTAGAAIDATDDVILVTPETNPDDIAGMEAAKGILTATGGTTSHAAVVARSMDTPCITGCETLIFENDVLASIEGYFIPEGTIITIDGATGKVWDGEVPVIDGSHGDAVAKATAWALDYAGVAVKTGDLLDVAAPTRIMAAEWVFDTNDLTDKLKEVVGATHKDNIILDLTDPEEFLCEDDRVLWGVCSGLKLPSPALALLNVSNEVNVNGLNVVLSGNTPLPIEQSLSDKGVNIVKATSTLKDVLSADGNVVSVTDKFITDVVGGHDVWKELCDVMKKAGKKLNTLPPAMSPLEALFEIIQED